jgi:hypothetical protein
MITCSFCLKEKIIPFCKMVIGTVESPQFTKELCKNCYLLLARHENSLYMRMHGIKYCDVCIQPNEDCDCKKKMKYDYNHKKNWI